MEPVVIAVKCVLEFQHWGMVVNFALFLSGLLLLINLAPRDILPSYKIQKQALVKLKSNKNILGNLPPRVNIILEGSGMSIIEDQEAFLILREMARKYSPNSSEINWNGIIGVGYSTLSAPVGKYKVDAFKPLYVAEIPTNESTTLILKPIGQLDDFEKWFLTEHASSVNLVAIIFLAIGFFLQLLIEFGWLGT